MVEDKHVAAFQDYRSNRSIILAVPVVGLMILFLYSRSFSFSAWIGINLLCRGTKDDNFGGQLHWPMGFGKICASQECWIRLILLIVFYIIRFCYLFLVFLFLHTSFSGLFYVDSTILIK